VISGVGTVVTLLPILIVFFVFLGLLEDLGYMARAAYVTDRFMHLMGLHGNSFLPLFLGFGCNVPAVLGARIVDSPKARLLTTMMIPIVPCAARLAVLAVLTPLFFGSHAVWVSLGLLSLNMILLGVIGVVLHELVLGGEHVSFIMELPLYHAPNVRTIGLSVWQRTVEFVKEAGSVILVVSVVVWAFSTLPEGNIETSYLASIGRLLIPLGALMGLGWQMMVALLTSFIRKENTIATLSVLYGSSSEGISPTAALRAALTPAAALAFLAVQMLFIPCVATVATIRQGTNSWRWTLFSIALLLAVSFAVGIVIYQVAQLLGIGM
jgi:ferrous iron transport protein B